VCVLVWIVALAAPAGAAAKPVAVVSLGDSAASGEAARNYEPGTNRPGNFCHRSRDALIHETAIPGVDATINLACSGATTANLRIDGAKRNGEPPQSERLAAIARDYDVRLVLVEIGANDDPRFSSVVTDCVTQFVLRSGLGCRVTVGPDWARRLAAMAPKVANALADVRTVMREAGYADASWQAVAASYWSPVPRPPIRYGRAARLLEGCPLYDADMAWGRDTAVPELSAALRAVARGAGWRFLDLQDSMGGREVCASGIRHSQEWTSGLTYDPFNGTPFGFDAVRQSFHANARGHAQLGACLREFHLAPAAAEGSCVRGEDGRLHAVV
jgi:lysophospholipase L1-like esterase